MAAATARTSARRRRLAPRDMLPHAEQAATLLRALANSQRLMILCNLSESALSVGELNARLPLSQSALSQHLAVLRETGIVTTRREAQTVFYSLSGGPAARVIGTLHDIYCVPQRSGA